MFISEFYVINEDEIVKNLIRLDAAFSRHIRNGEYTEKQVNQILKAKENNIYLFLDNNFTVDNLRFARTCFMDKNPENFLANYEEHTVDKQNINYKYKITTTQNNSYFVVEIVSKNNFVWNPTNEFKVEILEMYFDKSCNKFSRFTNEIYKRNYPFESPDEIIDADEDVVEYLQKLLQNEAHKASKKINKTGNKLTKYMHTIRIQNINNCMYKIDFKNKFTKQEILFLNHLMDKNKYNLLLKKHKN